MEKVTVTLTPTLKIFVDQKVRAGGFGSSAAYIEWLLQKAQEEQARLHVNRLLSAGVDSDAGEQTSQEWEELEREIRDSNPDLRLT